VIYTPQTADPRLINVEVIGEQKILDKYTQELYPAQIFKVTGKRLEQIVVMTDFSNHEAMARVYDVLKKMDVYKFLKKQNIKLGDIIRIAQKDIIYRGD
jgi:Obg family GTPase CgtA-like protein